MDRRVRGVGYSLASTNTRLTFYCEKLCLIASPLVPLLFIQLIASPNLESVETGPDYRTNDDSASPVYFFIFDGLSYVQTTQAGEFRPEFPHSKALSERAVMFRDARSPSTRTEVSIPSLVYQTRATEGLDGAAVWSALDAGQSPFEMARSSGYNTALGGFHVPYGAVLGAQLDYSSSSSHYPKGTNFASKVESTLVSNLRYLKDPVSVRLAKALFPPHYSRHGHDIGLKTVRRSEEVIRSGPANTLAVFHLPLPHWPFASNPDGSYFGHEGVETDFRGATGRPGYRRHLLYVDNLVGRFVELLETSGKFDDALVIVTSDHAGKTHKWHDEDLLSVPLIIKLPTRGREASSRTRSPTPRFGPLIQSVLRGDRDPDDLLLALREQAKHEPRAVGPRELDTPRLRSAR